ncbi:hypothetical protein ACC730_38250, partial [Rhizobium ruizarguesonis]
TKEGVAAGSFSNVACLSPRGAQTCTVLMRNDIDAALDLERRICTFMDAHIVPFRQEFGACDASQPDRFCHVYRAIGKPQ